MTYVNRTFFLQPTLTVAKELLGKVLIRAYRGKEIAGIITETEAYIGTDDLACHASKGKTQRTKIMWSRGGVLYVYMIYGMYFCTNIVTEEKGFPAAVLIRGVHLLESMGKQRTDGPGKVSRAFHINKTQTGVDITTSSSFRVEDRGIHLKNIRRTPRISVNYSGPWANKPWRFIGMYSG